MMKKWKKTLYIASQLDTLDDYGKAQYAKPVEYDFNVQPISSRADIQQFGQNASLIQKAVIPRKIYEGLFKEFDKAYLDGATPTGESYHGANANYRLYPPRNQNLLVVLYFEKIVNGENN